MAFIKLRKKNRLEEGFSLLELMVVMSVISILAVGGGLAYSGITKDARASLAVEQNCTQPGNVTKELVRYIEEYNVNNPNNQLGDFTIIDTGKTRYHSDTHPKLEDDAKFSLLVAKASACNSYKFDTLSGNHFTINTSKNFKNTNRPDLADWSQVYDSRTNSH